MTRTTTNKAKSVRSTNTKKADPRRATTVKAQMNRATKSTKSTKSGKSGNRRTFSTVRANITHTAPPLALNDAFETFQRAKAMIAAAVETLPVSISTELTHALRVVDAAITRISTVVATHTSRLGAETAFPPDVIKAYLALPPEGRRFADNHIRTVQHRLTHAGAPVSAIRENDSGKSTTELRRERRRTRTQSTLASLAGSKMAAAIALRVGPENG